MNSNEAHYRKGYSQGIAAAISILNKCYYTGSRGTMGRLIEELDIWLNEDVTKWRIGEVDQSPIFDIYKATQPKRKQQ
jgi:hypothetical protein